MHSWLIWQSAFCDGFVSHGGTGLWEEVLNDMVCATCSINCSQAGMP